MNSSNPPSVYTEANTPPVDTEASTPSTDTEANPPFVDAETTPAPVETETTPPPVETEANTPPEDPEAIPASVDTETNPPPVDTEANPPSVDTEANTTSVDTEDVKATHDKMTAIDSDVKWAVFKFVGGVMKTSLTGKDFEIFKAQFSDEEVAFAYYRLDHGVYVFMLWTGEKAAPTDKVAATAMQPFLQSIIKTFAHQLETSKIADVNPDNISKLVENAKGFSGGH